ncbi:uncharacterized protein EV422DRAFT_571435 [Fimicolochytrium jonesii]|uniref:uncharacterized protein n=1 Tax=Fimicolochytrium jonesii TaxID=1396493 RepID=UPI0022FE4841|nr:uncharacterized protein EV422DRAFT_571435 [Fimicolochytrium jonesii]KAI8816676.1 hypothetical protein EV422DRAFT_571435 [Fimicolochytrium jonesii]
MRKSAARERTYDVSSITSLTVEKHSPLTYETWDLGNRPTEILHLPHREGKKMRAVVLMIPGNPGLVEYYEEFLRRLHQALKGEMTFLGASHLGHSAAVRTIGKLYSVKEQVEHKLQLLDEVERRYGRDTKVVLIGHSFGAWVNIEILKARPDANVVKVFELFPAIMKIRASPQGRIFSLFDWPLIRTVPALLVGSIRFVAQPFPKLLNSLVSTFSRNHKTPREVSTTVERFLHYSTVSNAMHLASDEMRTIDELDVETIQKHAEKFVMYYGAGDHWVPQSQYEEMKNKFPNVTVHLCEDNIPHSFCLGYSDVMAEKVAKWLRTALGG